MYKILIKVKKAICNVVLLSKLHLLHQWCFILFILFSLNTNLSSQSPYLLRGDIAYHIYDRAELLLNRNSEIFNSINNYNRKELTNYFRAIFEDSLLTQKDKYDILHVLSDNIEFLEPGKIKDRYQSYIQNTDSLPVTISPDKTYFDQTPKLKAFYFSRSNFLQLETQNFSLYVNPILQISFYDEKNNDRPVFQNTRGIEARGYIDQKVYFFTQILENQRNYLSYLEERIEEFGVLPGQGSIKKYNSSVIKSLKGYDFFTARAYFGFNPIKNLNLELGHGNHFIGNGIRSLLLSDYSHNYLYFKMNFKFGNFQYQSIFSETSPPPAINSPGYAVLPKKYVAVHYLGFKPNSWCEIGLFESVVYKKENKFDLAYLNPLILYSTLENINSRSNNILLGLNMKFNIFRSVSIYGQLLTNEINPTKIVKSNGWWSKRTGSQLGIKYVNVLNADHLDIQFEYNAVMPYTYASTDTSSFSSSQTFANYSNFNQSLAHPLGANFKELLFIIRYKPTNRIYLQTKIINTIYGKDKKGENWGGNILLPFDNRQTDFGNYIGQGEKVMVKAINFDASYEFYQNYFLDFQVMWRQTTIDTKRDQHYFGGGIRINIANIHYDY